MYRCELHGTHRNPTCPTCGAVGKDEYICLYEKVCILEQQIQDLRALLAEIKELTAP